MTVMCVIIIRSFPPKTVYNMFFSCRQRKIAEMSFLRVSNLLQIAIEKVSLLVVEDLDSKGALLNTSVL